MVVVVVFWKDRQLFAYNRGPRVFVDTMFFYNILLVHYQWYVRGERALIEPMVSTLPSILKLIVPTLNKHPASNCTHIIAVPEINSTRIIAVPEINSTLGYYSRKYGSWTLFGLTMHVQYSLHPLVNKNEMSLPFMSSTADRM